MVTFDCETSRHDGVTVVTARLTEIDAPVRVTVRNRLVGPVWPPRREGVPEAGWTDAGFEGVVGPGSHALGYATPAPPAEPAATLEDVTPAADADPENDPLDTAADVVRALGDPSPPADAVPAGEECETAPPPRRSERNSTATTDRSRVAGSDPTANTDADSQGAPAENAPDRAEQTTAKLPAAVGPWVAEMARRTDHAEALSEVETLPAATAAVRDAGGLEEVRTLAADREREERQLRTLARRADRLADRRAAVVIPIETLATLA